MRVRVGVLVHPALAHKKTEIGTTKVSTFGDPKKLRLSVCAVRTERRPAPESWPSVAAMSITYISNV